MRVSASRLAALVAERLAPVVPPPFGVHAVGANLVVRHPAGWGYTMPLGWIEAEAEDRGGAALAEMVVNNALNGVQDAVSEATTDPWPPHSPGGTPPAMAPYHTRCDGTSIYLWYGVSEQAPVLAFAPIPLRDITRPG